VSDEDFDDAVTEEISSPEAEGRGVAIDDFVAYMPMHAYLFTPCRELWAGASVNARLPRMPVLDRHGQPVRNAKREVITISPTHWLDQNRPVEQMTWCPGLPMLITNRLVVLGGWIERPDVTCFNLYRPPRLELGDAGQAGPWLEHVHTVFNVDDATHILRWLAHRVQLPGQKINHALVLGGAQGIGKDTLLEPVKHAVGPWNFQEVSPVHLLGRFNGFVKSVILRVSEARDRGEIKIFILRSHQDLHCSAARRAAGRWKALARALCI
jgi:hypothetical protein